MGLRGRVAVVTGIHGVIGRAVAQRFVQEGARVIGAVGGRAVRGFRSGRVETVRANVASERDSRKLIETAVARTGRVDILVNAAGTAEPALQGRDIERISTAEWDHVFKIEWMGMFLCCRRAFPEMRRRGSGCIVNFSSAAAREGDPERLALSAAHAGVEGFTRALARQGAPEIRVNAVAPGPVREAGRIPGTKNRRPGRPVTPEEIADLVLYLVSDAAGAISGQTFVLDGGGWGPQGR